MSWLSCWLVCVITGTTCVKRPEITFRKENTTLVSTSRQQWVVLVSHTWSHFALRIYVTSKLHIYVWYSASQWTPKMQNCHVTILAAWFFLVLPLFPCPFVSCVCFPVCLVCQGVGRCGLPPPPPLGGHCWRSWGQSPIITHLQYIYPGLPATHRQIVPSPTGVFDRVRLSWILLTLDFAHALLFFGLTLFFSCSLRSAQLLLSSCFLPALPTHPLCASSTWTPACWTDQSVPLQRLGEINYILFPL